MGLPKNYIDERGNYQNVENLTLTQIYDRGVEDGYRSARDIYGKEKPHEDRVKGEWIRSSNMSKRSYQRVCNKCHNISYFCGNGNYPNCPYCLADMRGDNK